MSAAGCLGGGDAEGLCLNGAEAEGVPCRRCPLDRWTLAEVGTIYAVFASPTHTVLPNHLPTLIVTPHGQPTNILYSYLHTNFNAENYLLTPSPQGDLCVAKLFPPRPKESGKGSASDPGHGASSHSRVVRCEASRNLKWTIANTGVISPIYKLSLPSPDSPDLPLFQISKPNPNAAFWSMFYFAYAGHNIPPKRIEFGKIQKNPSTSGGGTRISITGKTPEEKAVWQTLGEGNEDCVEWVVLCAALNLLDDEILKSAEKNAPPVQLRDGPHKLVHLRRSTHTPFLYLEVEVEVDLLHRVILMAQVEGIQVLVPDLKDLLRQDTVGPAMFLVKDVEVPHQGAEGGPPPPHAAPQGPRRI
ncbi:hypothetical protein ONZ45_g11883 [Pleurotus djamor]|nr:hypothetical protein ONZ45_g11883 [Pleurotus djamor]